MAQAPDPNPRPLDHLAERGVPDAPALVLRERTLSHKDLRTRVARMAAWLQARLPESGAEHGARVATWAAQGVETKTATEAAAKRRVRVMGIFQNAPPPRKEPRTRSGVP